MHIDVFDPHIHIDGFGVLRGVPNKFKAKNQIAAGFKSVVVHDK
jgi:hypothetical protein